MLFTVPGSTGSFTSTFERRPSPAFKCSSTSVSRTWHSAPVIGQTISRYRVLEKPGGGGWVWFTKRRKLASGRLVGLKFLPSDVAHDAPALERFRSEARAASALHHAKYLQPSMKSAKAAIRRF